MRRSAELFWKGIDDPAILGEIEQVLKSIGYGKQERSGAQGA